jgi:Flp pilus assembly protein TadG
MRSLARIRALISDQRGASALEFALLIVPLLILVVGTIEYGRAVWTQHAMQSLAISTARCVAIQQNECAVSGTYDAARTRTHVINEAGKLAVPLTAANIAINTNTSCQGVAGFVKVTINYRFVSPAPDFITAMGTGPHLTATSCFPIQG